MDLFPSYITTGFQSATNETAERADVTPSLAHIHKAQLCGTGSRGEVLWLKVYELYNPMLRHDTKDPPEEMS